MSHFERMKQRWGVGPWGVLAILLAFSLAGMTTLRLKTPVLGLFMPETAPGWLQFDFFWGKLKAVGRLVSGRPARASG